LVDKGTNAFNTLFSFRVVKDKFWMFELLLRIGERIGVGLEDTALVLDNDLNLDGGLSWDAKRRFTCDDVLDLWSPVLALDQCGGKC